MPSKPQTSDEIDKPGLYGRYQRPADARAEIDTERLRWQNQLQKQLTHKSLDEPIADDHEMNVQVRRGMGWPELSIIGSVIVGLFVWQHTNSPGVQQTPAANYLHPVRVPENYEPRHYEDPRQTREPTTHTDRDTLMVPRLRFGPERQ